MKRFNIAGAVITGAGALLAAISLPHAAGAQDHNYVPGWATTTNHEYRGAEGGEWKAKTELFDILGARSPGARCTLQNLSEPDGNVIVNQFRRHERNTNRASALHTAHQQVDAHHRRLQAQGKC